MGCAILGCFDRYILLILILSFFFFVKDHIFVWVLRFLWRLNAFGFFSWGWCSICHKIESLSWDAIFGIWVTFYKICICVRGVWIDFCLLFFGFYVLLSVKKNASLSVLCYFGSFASFSFDFVF